MSIFPNPSEAKERPESIPVLLIEDDSTWIRLLKETIEESSGLELYEDRVLTTQDEVYGFLESKERFNGIVILDNNLGKAKGVGVSVAEKFQNIGAVVVCTSAEGIKTVSYGDLIIRKPEFELIEFLQDGYNDQVHALLQERNP